ncbi:hypothetical protein Poly51_17940 [Rubripirellula tenax]|uniref:Uncharacterized protein n=1 Tax=Rubripirellula tenax TaxID=2528015 RepID=A0A5C6FH59_9BACT|nr:hypothetical protein Poly51_17940 [Rubripirellula tenax]
MLGLRSIRTSLARTVWKLKQFPRFNFSDLGTPGTRNHSHLNPRSQSRTVTARSEIFKEKEEFRNLPCTEGRSLFTVYAS